MIDDSIMIDFPEQLPAGMKVDKNDDVYMTSFLIREGCEYITYVCMHVVGCVRTYISMYACVEWGM